MKREFTLIVQEFEPMEDLEMGTSGGFKVICQEFELSAHASTLQYALRYMGRMLEQELMRISSETPPEPTNANE